MSLYKDASLAMIPSAKDGKLYSIRPTLVGTLPLVAY